MFISAVYLDSDCIVINKAAGMPSHALKNATRDSASELLAKQYPELLKLPEYGLTHRLDTGTSGLLLFARNLASYTLFRHAFSHGLIEKTYVAFVEGYLEGPCVINLPLAHHPKNKAKMIAITAKNKYFRGKPQHATTEVLAVQRLDGYSEIHIKIQGGRRHQIRVHMAAIGHPLLGDVLYGAKPTTACLWHALHADSLVLPNGKKIICANKILHEN